MEIIDRTGVLISPDEDLIETDIEKWYHKIIEKKLYPFEFSFSKSSRTDGILEVHTHVEKLKGLYRLKILSEFKRDSFSLQLFIDCLCQVLYYILNMKKEFSKHDLKKYPDIILIGFKDSFIVLSISSIESFLYHKELLEVQNGSDAAKKCQILKEEIVNNKQVIATKYSNQDIINCIDIFDKVYKNNCPAKIPFDIDTSSVVVSEFKSLILSKQLLSEDIASLLISVFTNQRDNYIDNIDPNLLHTQFKLFPKLKIDGKNFKQFIEKYKLKDEIIEAKHQMFSPEAKRGKGQFYTPLVVSEDAQKEIGIALQDKNWRLKSVVIDNSSGGENLTSLYDDYKKLFCFTLLQSDIDATKDINKHIKISAKMDYLDDLGPEILNEGPYNIPKEYNLLLELFENNPDCLFVPFNNYPFRAQDQENAELGSVNKIAEIMKNSDNRIKNCFNQLFAGFIFRLLRTKEHFNLTNYCPAFFCKLTFFQSNDFLTLRERFLKNFTFIRGCLYESKLFGTDELWPVAFSIWKPGNDIRKTSFQFNVKQLNVKSGKLEIVDKINLYSLEDTLNKAYPTIPYKASSWASLKNKRIKKEESFKTVPLMSGFNKTEGPKKIKQNTIACLQNHSNNIGSSIKLTSIYTGKPNDSVIEIQDENILKACALFTTRRLSTRLYPEWYRETLEFSNPVECDEFDIWAKNSIIFFLFSNQSHQSSLRNLKGNNKNLINECFWIDRAEVEKKNIKDQNNNILNDLQNFSGDRKIATKLVNVKKQNVLYPESLNLLSYISKIVLNSYKKREQIYISNASIFYEYHLMCWDAGWEQLRRCPNLFSKAEEEKYKSLLNILRQKLISGIHDYRFLMEN